MKMLGMVPVEKLRPNVWNAIEISVEDEAKLKAQMRVSGPEHTEPVTVKRVGDSWMIINGEKRWRIAKALGWTHIPAVEISATDYEVKKYCLSYNMLRGTVNYVKLARLLASDEEMFKVCVELLGKEKTEELMESGKRLTEQAEKILDQAVKQGGVITPEKIKMVAESPPEHQAGIAKAAMEQTDLDYMMIVRERLVGGGAEIEEEEIEEEEEEIEEKGEKEKGKKEEKTTEEESKPEREKPKASEGKTKQRELEIYGKAIEAASEFVCECGQAYVVLYDREKKAIQVRRVKEAKAVQATDGESTAPRIYQMILKVDGGTWIGEIDALTGEYHFRRQD